MYSMCGIGGKLFWVVCMLATVSTASAEAVAANQCIRLFSALAPNGSIINLSTDKMLGFEHALANNNLINPRVRSIAIFRDDTVSHVTYTVLDGSGSPVYKGADIFEMADQIDAATKAAGAHTVYASLAGFSPLKGHAMQTDMNIQWARVNAKSKMIVRVPDMDQAGKIDVALPPEFFLSSVSLRQAIRVEPLTGPGNRIWYQVAVDFIVTVKSTSQKFTVRFLVRTKQALRQLEQIMIKFKPEWAISHPSPAEVVSQIVAEMQKKNKGAKPDALRIQVMDQFGKNHFVDNQQSKGAMNAGA